ncbi:MAG: zinc ribbon domain-containing protein [Acidobacteria bacterium]|nr:zinc ribbon domain-containing protein [Acidobacteriota bacterium]
MFCATCNLHYPDHLNFCRRCGQPLVESSGEPVIESHCCTRCGARVVRGEHFCQQCGCKLLVKAQETVVGACYHCGALWRTGWLFCKSCGLDRDRALLAPVSTPPSPSMKINPLLMPVDEAPKIERYTARNAALRPSPSRVTVKRAERMSGRRLPANCPCLSRELRQGVLLTSTRPISRGQTYSPNRWRH